MKIEQLYRVEIRDHTFDLTQEEFDGLRNAILSVRLDKNGKAKPKRDGTVARCDIFEECFIEAGTHLTIKQLEKRLLEKGKQFATRDTLTMYLRADERFVKVSRATWDLAPSDRRWPGLVSLDCLEKVKGLDKICSHESTASPSPP